MDGDSSVQLLYVWASPYSMRVELALALKGVECEKVWQDLDNKSELLLQSNPVHKKIPVLIHNGKPVCESSVIVQYVDEAWPAVSPLLPLEPYDRAIARFWADFVDKKVFDALFAVLKSKGEEKKAAAVENAIGVMATLEEGLRSVRKEGPFFGGATVGFADIMLGPLLHWKPTFEAIGDFELPMEKYPCLQEWFAAVREHPMACVLPEVPKLIKLVSEVIRRRQTAGTWS